jgi:hypothetical protein
MPRETGDAARFSGYSKNLPYQFNTHFYIISRGSSIDRI